MLARILIGVILLGSVVSGQTKDYKLPADRNSIILSLDYRGGFTPPRTVKDPFFSIRADGTMLVTDIFGHSGKKPLSAELTKGEVQKLLRFVLKEQRLLDWDPKAVKKELKARAESGHPMAYVADAQTTVICVDIPEHRGEARQYALDVAARAAPKCAPMQRLLAVERRMQQLMSIITAGGKKQVQASVAALNAELAKKHPKHPRFVAADLASATRYRDGRRVICFRRTQGKTETIGTVIMPEKGKPQVKILQQPKRLY